MVRNKAIFVKNIIKRNPFLYKILKILYSCFESPRNPLHWIHFIVNKQLGRPYFGSYLISKQTWPVRYPIMKKIINEELRNADSTFRMLEIGAWAGMSTVLWASAFVENGKGMLVVVDSWGAARNSPEAMKAATKNNKIFKMFLHNIEASGVGNCIIPIRGSSDKVTELLKQETFNFIYIDGDHSYLGFKKDLFNCIDIVKVNGIISGDDFELCARDIDLEYAKKNSEKDWIVDPQSKEGFHPGVTIALNEVFGDKVVMKDGFWAVRKTIDGWEGVNL